MDFKKIWYYGYDLTDGWGMSDADYEHHLLTGDLIARDRPDIASETYSIEDIRTHLKGYYGFYWFDKCDLYFHVDNVMEFEKKHGLDVFSKQISKIIPKPKQSFVSRFISLLSHRTCQINPPDESRDPAVESGTTREDSQKTKPTKQDEFEKEGLDQLSKYIPNNLPEPVVEQSHIETLPDNFIRKLVLHPINDNEIVFQAGQKKRTFPLDRLGNEQKKELRRIHRAST